jgi:hypothetical protein
MLRTQLDVIQVRDQNSRVSVIVTDSSFDVYQGGTNYGIKMIQKLISTIENEWVLFAVQ